MISFKEHTLTAKLIRLGFLAMALSLLIPAGAMGAGKSDYTRRIAETDQQIERVLARRKANTRAQQELDAWTARAGAWLDQYNQVNREMMQARQRVGDYATMDGGQLDANLASMQQELANIINPPGGRVVGNRRYANLNELQKDMVDKAEEVKALQVDYHDLTQQLLSLDAQRDKLANKAWQENSLTVAENHVLQEELKETYYRKVAMVNDPDLWCEQASSRSKTGAIGTGPIICRERKMVLITIAEQYRNEMMATGKQFNQQEMVDIIKRVQERSNRVKRQIREDELPVLDKAIRTLQAEERGGPENVELAGCWLLHEPGGSEHAMLNIQKTTSGKFRASLTQPGWLDYQAGHVLFIVKRVNATTFEGTEISFWNGKRSETRLRIIVDQNRTGASYRTKDDFVTLAPCKVGM